ncbi:MAG: peptidoglycan editing factor PgeF [Hyphomonadaceae bacterium]|nr:peptidoglycan editing factor PgeF [Hyphomonadaceae bacterium]
MHLQPESSTPSRLLSGAPPHWTAGALAELRHGFFGRDGGVSTGIYASLNAGTGSKDDPDAVRENRRRIARAFGVDVLVGVHQVHSPNVVTITAPFPGERPHADALVTTTPNLVLSILTADCAPVLLADKAAGVIGAAHAGWKGALGGVLEATVEAMRAQGAQNIAAAIGPCIHQASYEVGPEFEETFCAADKSYSQFFVAGAGDRRRFDLPAFCASRLTHAGATRVDIIAHDTYPDAQRLFSNRRAFHKNEGDYGRNCAAISL